MGCRRGGRGRMSWGLLGSGETIMGWGCPVYAGIDLKEAMRLWAKLGMPRVCGDRPNKYIRGIFDAMVAPCMRG